MFRRLSPDPLDWSDEEGGLRSDTGRILLYHPEGGRPLSPSSTPGLPPAVVGYKTPSHWGEGIYTPPVFWGGGGGRREARGGQGPLVVV